MLAALGEPGCIPYLVSASFAFVLAAAMAGAERLLPCSICCRFRRATQMTSQDAMRLTGQTV